MAATVRSAALLLLAVGCGCATGLLTPARLPGVSVCTSPHRVAQAPRACALPSASPPPSSDDLAAAPSATAVEDAVPSRGPRPELSPMEVVQAQLALFKSAEEEDLDQCWSFFSPYGPTYDVHSSSAGPCARFKWTIRREPRWRQIGGRPMSALFKLYRWEVLSQMSFGDSKFVIRIRAFPFFPDAPTAESEATFSWTLTRLCDSSGRDRYGSLEGCWVVHDVTADFEGWLVHMP